MGLLFGCVPFELKIRLQSGKVIFAKKTLQGEAMTSNSEKIIQDVRVQFEQMLDFVTGERAQSASAYQIERGLFKLLVSLGFSLLQLFFMVRSEKSHRTKVELADGQELPYHRDTGRSYFSIFGKLRFERPYFYKQGVGQRIPLDEELSLQADGYSDLLRELSGYLDVDNVYAKTADMFKRLLGLSLSKRSLQGNILEDSADVLAYYDQKAPPTPVPGASILVAQADGKGIPMVLEPKQPEKPVRLGKGQKRGHKKEALVTSAYTIAPLIRTPQEVVNSFFDLATFEFDIETQKQVRPKPQNKHTWATLDGKDEALQRLDKYVRLLEGSPIQDRVALCDGCEALQLRLRLYLDDFTLVLDFIHASEYLWKVANALLGETSSERIPWMAEKTWLMLSGKTVQLISEFRQMTQADKVSANLLEQLNLTANYFERNLPYMDYPTYLAKGWPIASGVIEGACRHFVKDRCELSGMRWSQSGAEGLLRMRAVAENDDWNDYHAYLRQQRHQRLYGKSLEPSRCAELLAIHESNDYSALPLAG